MEHFTRCQMWRPLYFIKNLPKLMFPAIKLHCRVRWWFNYHQWMRLTLENVCHMYIIWQKWEESHLRLGPTTVEKCMPIFLWKVCTQSQSAPLRCSADFVTQSVLVLLLDANLNLSEKKKFNHESAIYTQKFSLADEFRQRFVPRKDLPFVVWRTYETISLNESISFLYKQLTVKDFEAFWSGREV